MARKAQPIQYCRAQVVQNDTPSSYYTQSTVAHLIANPSGWTLCGRWWKKWLTKPRESIGGACLCASCDRIARSKGLLID